MVSEIAKGHWIAARSYLNAIGRLVDDGELAPEQQIMTVLPANLLAGFCLELELKAWLAIKGQTEQQLRGYSHRLNEAFDAACQNGLPAIVEIDRLVQKFSAGHSDLNYRYLRAGEVIPVIGLEEWPWALTIMIELNDIVEQQIGLALQAEV